MYETFILVNNWLTGLLGLFVLGLMMLLAATSVLALVMVFAKFVFVTSFVVTGTGRNNMVPQQPVVARIENEPVRGRR